jgi:hypothetical protein
MANGMGDAVITLTRPDKSAEMDARMLVESCDDLRRILIEPPLAQLPAQGACTRQDSGWLFSVRSETSFVVDLGASQPQVRVRQGSLPSSWLTRTAPGESPSGDSDFGPPGGALVLSGGGGLLNGLSISTPQCGDVADCTLGHYKPVYSAGATWWMSRIVGVHASLTRATDISAEGTATSFNFKTATQLEALNVAGTVGVPAGIARIYGLGGMTYHRATTKTTETILANGNNPGGTQSLDLRTEGWGLLFGGGVEVWATRRVGFFGEVTRAKLKGDDVKNGPATLDVGALSGVLGIRLTLFD